MSENDKAVTKAILTLAEQLSVKALDSLIKKMTWRSDNEKLNEKQLKKNATAEYTEMFKSKRLRGLL